MLCMRNASVLHEIAWTAMQRSLKPDKRLALLRLLRAPLQ